MAFREARGDGAAAPRLRGRPRGERRGHAGGWRSAAAAREDRRAGLLDSRTSAVGNVRIVSARPSWHLRLLRGPSSEAQYYRETNCRLHRSRRCRPVTDSPPVACPDDADAGRRNPPPRPLLLRAGDGADHDRHRTRRRATARCVVEADSERFFRRSRDHARPARATSAFTRSSSRTCPRRVQLRAEVCSRTEVARSARRRSR